MGFVTRNEDVFKLSGAGAQVVHSPNIRVIERRHQDDYPIGLEIELRAVEPPPEPAPPPPPPPPSLWPFRRAQPAPIADPVSVPVPSRAATPDTVEIEWANISKNRRERGDFVDFTVTLTRERPVFAGDLLILRVPIVPEAIHDPDFALTVAASFQSYVAGTVAGVELGVGSELGLQFAFPFGDGVAGHMATGYKFDPVPKHPYIELRFHLGASLAPPKIRIARMFAGYDYDPYVFNPEYEYRAHLMGRPAFASGTEVLAEFERLARAACQTHRYFGQQAFIKPFLVMREGARRFPMLIGTPNSMSWYGLEPFHGMEQYESAGWVRPGDVSLDCGAHAGQMATFFSLVGGKGSKVIAFDPFPQNYLQVEAQGRLNGLENFASARAGVGPANTTMSLSILGQQTTVTSRTENLTDKVDVKIVSLDDYIDAKPTFIKFDVEGAEVGALQGAQELLARCKPRIFTELHTQFLGDFGHSPKDFFDAIPRSLYRVFYQIEGRHTGWREYEEGDHEHVTTPGLVFAEPR